MQEKQTMHEGNGSDDLDIMNGELRNSFVKMFYYIYKDFFSR